MVALSPIAVSNWERFKPPEKPVHVTVIESLKVQDPVALIIGVGGGVGVLGVQYSCSTASLKLTLLSEGGVTHALPKNLPHNHVVNIY